MAHIGYCSLHGFPIKRPNWLVNLAAALLGGGGATGRPLDFSSLHEDMVTVDDLGLLSQLPTFYSWWTVYPFGPAPPRDEYMDYLEEVATLVRFTNITSADYTNNAQEFDAFSGSLDFFPLHIEGPEPKPGVEAGVSDLQKILLNTRTLGDSTINLAEHNIRTTSHAAQLYEALTNLYRLAGPHPFESNTGAITEHTLQKLSALNGVNISTITDPLFFSDLRLGVPLTSEQPERPDPPNAPRWQSVPPEPSPIADSIKHLVAATVVSPGHDDAPPDQISDDDSDTPHHDGNVSGAEGDDPENNGDDYEMNDEDNIIVGVPEYHITASSDFTSSGSVGSTSSSESDDDD